MPAEYRYNVRVRGTLLIFALLLTVLGAASCGTGSTGLPASVELAQRPPVNVNQPGVLPGLTALLRDGADTYLRGDGTAAAAGTLLIDSGSGEGNLSYAVYQFATSPSARYPVQIRCETVGGSGDYFIGIANYGTGHWQFGGPSSGLGTYPISGSGQYLSPGQSVYVVVLTHSGGSVSVGEVELKASSNQPPVAPSGLTAQVLSGSVRLTWNASTDAGLAGYNVYFAEQPFEFPGESSVAKANTSLVSVTSSPSFELLQLDSGRTYYFRVSAVVADQVESQLSTLVEATTNYAIALDVIKPQRQYPGFWCYLTGSGFDAAPGATKVIIGNTELPPADVQDVSPGQLRFRVPDSASVDSTQNIRVKVGSDTSEPIALVIAHPADSPRAFAHVGQTLYREFETYQPRGVAVDGNGRIWIASTTAQRIDCFNADGTPHDSIPFAFPADIEALAGGDLLIKSYFEPGCWIYDAQLERLDPVVPAAQLGGFMRGFYCAQGPGGEVYCSDYDGGVVRKYAGGMHVLDIGAGVLLNPTDVETYANGNLIVADAGRNQIYWFDPAGTLLGAYNGSDDLSPNDGELRTPMGMALSADGQSLYIANVDRMKIVELHPATRTFVGEWGLPGYQDGSEFPGSPVGTEGRFTAAWGVAVLPDGNVVVSDSTNQRAGIYDDDSGNLISGFGDYIREPGHLLSPRSIAFRPSDGAFAVLDNATYAVTVFSLDNQWLEHRYLESNGAGADFLSGRLERPAYGIAWNPLLAGGGKLFISHGLTRLTEFSEDLEDYRVLAFEPGAGPNQLAWTNSLATTATELFVLDKDNNRVQVYDHTGNFARSIAIPEPNFNAHRIAVDALHGKLFVSGKPFTADAAVLRMNLTGTFVDKLDSPDGELWGQLLAVDPAGYVYVDANEQGNIFAKYEPSSTAGQPWTLIDRFGLYGDGDGQFREVQDLAISADGRFCVADSGRQQVVVLMP
jgi:hypothetical protein